MKTSVRKTLSVIVTGAMLLGLSGCLKPAGSTKDVIKAAKALADNMVSLSADDIIKNSTLDKKSDEATKITDLFGGEYSEDQLAFFKAVEGTIDYEVDEDSCDMDKDEASVDIIFTIADTDQMLDEEYTDIDALTSAVKDADTKEITFTAEFILEDGDWLCDNIGGKKFLSLYGYRSAEFTFPLTPEMIAGYIDRELSDFWLTDGGIYTDTTFIEYDYYFLSEISELADRGSYMLFVLMKDGYEIYRSDPYLIGSEGSLSCRVDIDLIDGNSGDYFNEGTYTIRLITEDTQIIDEESVAVEVTPEPTDPVPTITPTYEGEGVFYAYTDESFRDYVIEAKWFDYDGYKTDDYAYSLDVQTIAFSLQVTPDCDRTVQYYYSYSADESAESIDLAIDNYEYMDTVSPVEYTNGYFYDIDYPVNGNAQAGYYVVVINDAQTGENLMYGYCEVGLN